MAGDPNARRDKALETIARELGEANKLLARIERNTRRVTFKDSPPDPYDVPQQPQPGKSEDKPAWMTDVRVPIPPEVVPERKFPEPTHPYLKRSESVENNNAAE